MQGLADISAFPELSAGLVLLLLRCANFVESNLDVRWELQGWPVERTRLLFLETSFEL